MVFVLAYQIHNVLLYCYYLTCKGLITLMHTGLAITLHKLIDYITKDR
jgi:hypothetical protein